MAPEVPGWCPGVRLSGKWVLASGDGGSWAWDGDKTPQVEAAAEEAEKPGPSPTAGGLGVRRDQQSPGLSVTGPGTSPTDVLAVQWLSPHPEP